VDGFRTEIVAFLSVGSEPVVGPVLGRAFRHKGESGDDLLLVGSEGGVVKEKIEVVLLFERFEVLARELVGFRNQRIRRGGHRERSEMEMIETDQKVEKDSRE
jgi:hypothetical protein